MSKETINAFHPKYIETYMPELMAKVRIEEAQRVNGIKSGILARATRESDGRASTSPLSSFPKTKRVSLEPTPFHIYSKAGIK